MRTMLKSVLVTLVAALALSTAIAATASASQPRWYTCVKNPVGTGAKYTSKGECEKEEHSGSGEWEWLELQKSQAVTFQGIGTQKLDIPSNGFAASCEKVESDGVLYPGGNAESSQLKYTGCQVETPSNCPDIYSPGEPNGTIVMVDDPSELMVSEGKTYEEIAENPIAKEFTDIIIEKEEHKCGIISINNTLTGTFRGEVLNSTQELEFDGEGTLKLESRELKIYGKVHQELAGGGKVLVHEAATPAAPAVETRAASGITATGATLNGIIDPEGLATTYHFEYGETTSYGNDVPVPDASAGSGTGDIEAGRAITGLKTGSTYHFRLVASNADGTTYGADAVLSAVPTWEVKEGETWKTLEGSESRNVVMKQRGTQTLSVQVDKAEITCEKMEGKGKIESEGRGEESERKYTGCKVIQPTKCEYISTAGQPNGTIVLLPLPTQLVANEGTVYDEIKENATSNEIAALNVRKEEQSESAKCGLISKTSRLHGSLLGKVDNATQELEFEGKGTLTLTTIAAEYFGKNLLEREGGGAIRTN